MQMQAEHMHGEYLTTEQVAQRLHCSTSKLHKDRFNGRGLPYVKHGRQVLYFWPDVVSALSERTVAPQQVG